MKTKSRIFFEALQKSFNNKIYKKADLVTTVSQRLSDNIIAQCSTDANVLVLRNGIGQQMKKQNAPEGLANWAKQLFVRNMGDAFESYEVIQTIVMDA